MSMVPLRLLCFYPLSLVCNNYGVEVEKMNLFSFGVSFNLFYFENSISSVVAKLKRGPFQCFLFHFEVIQIARVVKQSVGGSWLTTVKD